MVQEEVASVIVEPAVEAERVAVEVETVPEVAQEADPEVVTRSGLPSPSSVDSSSTTTSSHLRRSTLTQSPLRSLRSLIFSSRRIRESSLMRS